MSDKELHLELQDRFGCDLPPGFVERVVSAVLRFVERPDMEVSILLADEREIAEVHERFLDDATGTDVISFPLEDGVDMIVSAERARNESSARGHAFEAELALYIVHGILHVSGFDDHTPAERASMREAERKVLSDLGLSVPSVDD